MRNYFFTPYHLNLKQIIALKKFPVTSKKNFATKMIFRFSVEITKTQILFGVGYNFFVSTIGREKFL